MTLEKVSILFAQKQIFVSYDVIIKLSALCQYASSHASLSNGYSLRNKC